MKWKIQAIFIFLQAIWQITITMRWNPISSLWLQKLEPYLRKIEAGESAIDRAYETTPEERVTREMILLLKRGYLEVGYFREKYAVDVLERFGDVWGSLRDQRMLKFDEDRIELTPDGLLRVDQLLSEFYAEQYRDARYT